MSTPGEKAVADTDRASDRQSRVFLLGRFEVWLGDSIVIDRSWSRRKARTLLKLLAVQPARTMHRDQVQGWLWPDLDATAAANNLHKNLHFLRAALALEVWTRNCRKVGDYAARFGGRRATW